MRQKKVKETTREESTPMLVLRALQIGLHLSDLEQITLGDLVDILIERENDEFEYPIKASQEDFRSF